MEYRMVKVKKKNQVDKLSTGVKLIAPHSQRISAMYMCRGLVQSVLVPA